MTSRSTATKNRAIYNQESKESIIEAAIMRCQKSEVWEIAAKLERSERQVVNYIRQAKQVIPFVFQEIKNETTVWEIEDIRKRALQVMIGGADALLGHKFKQFSKIISDDEVCIHNSVFRVKPGIDYKNDYIQIAKDCANKVVDEKEVYRNLCKNDLWFFVYFGMGTTPANHKFWVDACRDVEEGARTDTLDMWARDHGKSTIITIGESLQDIFKNPNERICIYSYCKKAAQVFYFAIKQHLDSNEFFKYLFDDVLWEQVKDSPWWNDDGIVVRRNGIMKEATVEPWGLTEGMPTGRHFTKRVYDDIMTADMANSPKVIQQVKDNFDMSQNTGSDGDRQRVIGTPYRHDDVIMYVEGRKNEEDQMEFQVRRKPATDDGTFTGKPVLLSQKRLDKLKMNKKQFAAQQLLNPRYDDNENLNFNNIKMATEDDLPKRVFKFMVVDPAGDKSRNLDTGGDSWAMWVVGVDPFINDAGASKVFIMDGLVAPLDWDEAIKEVCNMYLRNGWITKLGIEKVALSTTEMAISNALRAKGRTVTVENKMLHILRPGGRSKQRRIEGNLLAPLKTGLLYMMPSVPELAQDRLRQEMDKYPLWRDDGIDALAYAWDIIKEYRFPRADQQGEVEEGERSLFDRIRERKYAFGSKNTKTSWMAD
jgi:hypothetical protein